MLVCTPAAISCGFADIISMDALNPIEIKAGMDPLYIKENTVAGWCFTVPCAVMTIRTRLLLRLSGQFPC